MKKADVIRRVIYVALAIQLVSCNKFDDLFHHHPGNGEGGEGTTPVLKEMIIGSSHYMFYYNKERNVDSVVIKGLNYQVTYRVFYSGTKIDSVTTFQDGAIVSVNRDFVYDNKGNIIQYTYYLRMAPDALPTIYNFKYDNKNRIINASSKFYTYENNHTFTYDSNNDMIKVTPDLTDRSIAYATYTYDDKLNPLYYVKNLFAIFVEEPFIWEYEFSQHNSVTKQLPNKPQNVFVNEYNNKDQLVKKTLDYEIWSQANSFVFSYYN